MTDKRNSGLPLAIYILYFAGLVAWFPAAVGVLLAHVNRNGAPDLDRQSLPLADPDVLDRHRGGNRRRPVDVG